MSDALIWGASGGIGRALVSHLKYNGWRVFAAARNTVNIPSEADFSYKFDAATWETIQDTTLAIAHETRGLDLMVYAAGGMVAKTADALDPSEWGRVMDANLNGAYLAARGSLNLLKEGAHVMFIGAYVDKITLPKFAAYTAAKAGLEPLVTILKKENRKTKFTLVRPGAVATPFWDNVPFTLPKGALSPQSVAEAVLNRYNAGEEGSLDL
jgi:3-oxoacyl-[acyl-carrier protein] reductase